MSSRDSDPILEARPPATDPLTYLTILEYNLNAEKLPKLHLALQDKKLTSSIGWDLVQLLLPMVPAANECLNDVACMGNPREVILKVTEALSMLDWEVAAAAAVSQTASSAETGRQRELEQFNILLTMLSVLHKRLSTKKPSRFIATTIRAIMNTYRKVDGWAERLSMVHSIARLVSELMAACKPALPRRALANASDVHLAPDPEHDQAEGLDRNDVDLCRRLLQSFLGCVHEDLARLAHEDPQIGGLRLAERLWQQISPAKISPITPSFEERLRSNVTLQSLNGAVQAIHGALHSLSLSNETLFGFACQPNAEADWIDMQETSAAALDKTHVSGAGALMLLASASTLTCIEEQRNPFQNKFYFPDFSKLLMKHAVHQRLFDCLGTLSGSSASIFDSLLAIGLLHLHGGGLGNVPLKDDFFRHMQALSLVSAVSLSADLRFSAHTLATNTLALHPDAETRLAFIRDTLEHCPIANLKVSAVGWFKNETLHATAPLPQGVRNVFSTPVALESISLVVFPDLAQQFNGSDSREAWDELEAQLPFFLSVLNMYYLFISNREAAKALQMKDFHLSKSVEAGFLSPLRQLSIHARQQLGPRQEKSEQEDVAWLDDCPLQLMVLDSALERIDESIAKLD